MWVRNSENFQLFSKGVEQGPQQHQAAGLGTSSSLRFQGTRKIFGAAEVQEEVSGQTEIRIQKEALK